MKRITIEIETGNAAFDDNHTGEICRILRAAADRLESCGEGFALHDLNGNRVGRLHIEWEA